jgi:hypothetical protein
MLLLENISHDELKKNIKELYDYAIGFLKIDRAPKIIFKRDEKNAEDIFGKTGYYDPDSETIALYIINRHAKDILRSFAHELIHHEQKCIGESDNVDLSLTATDPAYAMHDEGLREMERRAFEEGNMIFRDWCDTKKMEKKNTMSESKQLVDVILEKLKERLVIKEAEMTSAEKKKEKEIKKAIPDEEMKKRYGKKAKDVEAATAKKIAKKVAEGAKMPMKLDKEDADNDGDTSDKVPAFLDKGDVKKKKKGGKVPPQLQKHVKEKSKKNGKTDAKEISKHVRGEDEKKLKEEQEELQENLNVPYPKLFEKKNRLFNERFSEYEQWKFEELLKKAIKK